MKAHPHAFRRGVATSLARDGQPPRDAEQSYLGHGSLETTAGYVAVNVAELREATDLLDRGGGQPGHSSQVGADG